jgi:(1->4)-alpha-D-glucan 1-alpha-D-glucosylmutase
VAFLRGAGAITVVPRLVMSLHENWGDTVVKIPAGAWRDELTGEGVEGGEVELARLLARFPVSLLSKV